MKQFFSFDAEAGELLQIRLRDGSWKNDSKRYVRVAPDGTFQEVSQSEAGQAIAQMKLERKLGAQGGWTARCVMMSHIHRLFAKYCNRRF